MQSSEQKFKFQQTAVGHRRCTVGKSILRQFSYWSFKEIPDFLAQEECEHLIKKAEETGLTLSEVGLPEENSTHVDKLASKQSLNAFEMALLLCRA